MGVPEADLAKLAGARDAEHRPFEVLRENWPAVRLFEVCATQWRYAPDGQFVGGMGVTSGAIGGRRVGLDYAAAVAIAPVYGIAMTADLVDRLRMLEAYALDELIKIRAERD